MSRQKVNLILLILVHPVYSIFCFAKIWCLYLGSEENLNLLSIKKLRLCFWLYNKLVSYAFDEVELASFSSFSGMLGVWRGIAERSSSFQTLGLGKEIFSGEFTLHWLIWFSFLMCLTNCSLRICIILFVYYYYLYICKLRFTK